MDTTLTQLSNEIIAFRDARDWKRFHTLKNLLVSLNLEASELLEFAQWKSDAELLDFAMSESGAEAIADECADIFVYLLLISRECNIDLIQATRAKLSKNAQKYPLDKAYGSAKKYTEL